MNKTVFCRKYQKELEALAMPPMPGTKGQDIIANVSKKAWTEWMSHQTLLINEKRLNLMDLTDRAYLDGQRELFFSGETVDQAEGYVAPKT